MANPLVQFSDGLPIQPVGGDYVPIRTTNQLFQNDSRDKDQSNKNALFKTAALTVGGVTVFNMLNSIVDFNPTKYTTFTDYAVQPNSSNAITGIADIKEGRKLTFGDLLFENIRKVEEYSPERVLRTFQLSPLLGPFISSERSRFHIAPEDLAANQDAYTAILSQGNKPLDVHALTNGLVFEDNKLYLADAEKKAIKSEVYLEHARLVFPYMKVPKWDPEIEEGAGFRNSLYVNKVFKNYMNILGSNWDVRESLKEGRLPFAVIGSSSREKMYSDYSRGFMRSAIQRGAEAWDKPIEALESMFGGDENIFGRATSLFKLNLGTSGNYDLGVRESILKIGKSVGTKVGFGALAFYAADKVSRNIAPEDSYYKNGLVAGLAASTAGLHVRYASLVSDHFEGLRQKQEEIAPGSTKLSTMAGLPTSFALAGAMGSYFQYIKDVNVHGYEVAQQISQDIQPTFKVGGKNLLGDWTSRFTGRRMTRYALRGAALGLLLEAPFLPGAILSGDTSNELKARYSGEEEVPVYANRFWGGGGGPWNSGKVKYFRQSLLYLKMQDYDSEVEGGYDVKEKTNPFLHPFDYLRDPYAQEKATDADRPYPVWGMDVSSGSFFGKFFEKTIGQLIKPDKLNPRLADYTNQEGDSWSYEQNISPGDASLIAEGKELAPQSARKDDISQAGRWSWGAFKEFIGIKGFAISQFEDALGYDFNGLDGSQLARSGEMTNSARDLSEMQLGGIGPIGEFQRRFIPTTAGQISNNVNPLPNNMPSWLPHNKDDYYINFGKGDPYREIDFGAARLPGAAYEKLHPELQGLNAEDYPDIYKYRILTDVALGSDEYYHLKKIEDKRYKTGEMNDVELSIYARIKEQELKRARTKDFYEYKTKEDLDRLGAGAGLAKYWEFLAHDASELPYEKLSIIRPSSKFIHQRTALEDYQTTQIDTGDAAMWNKPYQHYISPFITQVAREVGEDRVPEKTQDRRAIDEYFDKLEYMKYRMLYKEAVNQNDDQAAAEYKKNFQKTMEGSLASGLENEKDVLYAFIGLPKRERDYFGSFVNAEKKDRGSILSSVPDNVGAIYGELWKRKDVLEKYYDPSTGTIDQAKAEQEINQQITEENAILAKGNKAAYNTYSKSKELQKQGTFRQYLADLDSANYIQQTTGMPDRDFAGWDPRIDLKQVKLRTLSVGGEDLYEYGFYKNDVQNLKRMISILNEKQVTNQIQEQKTRIKTQKNLENEVRQSLIKDKMNPTLVQVLPTRGQSQATINLSDN